MPPMERRLSEKNVKAVDGTVRRFGNLLSGTYLMTAMGYHVSDGCINEMYNMIAQDDKETQWPTLEKFQDYMRDPKSVFSWQRISFFGPKNIRWNSSEKGHILTDVDIYPKFDSFPGMGHELYMLNYKPIPVTMHLRRERKDFKIIFSKIDKREFTDIEKQRYGVKS